MVETAENWPRDDATSVVDGSREYRVAITHDEPVRLVAGAEASELLCGPLSRRVFSDIPMQNAPASPLGFVRRCR